MLPIRLDVVVLWLHVLAACVWIGGQVTVAVLIPMLRELEGLAAAAGRRYQQIAWPAFAVLLGTGVVNVHNAGIGWSTLATTTVGRTVALKLGFVGISGAAAMVHAFLQAPRSSRRPTRRPIASASLGTVGLLSAVVAALYGVVIAGT